MNDLLADSSHKAAGGINGGDLDIENGMSIPPVEGQDMSQFFSEVNDIKNGMVDIRKKFQKLQDANEETKSVTRAAAMKELKERMEHDLDDVSRVAQGLKVKVEALDRANISNRKIKGCHEGSSTDRTRMSITATLKKKLKDLMLDFQVLLLSCLDTPLISAYRKAAVDVSLCCLLLGLNFVCLCLTELF
jgi:syntaxin 1B/2/3